MATHHFQPIHYHTAIGSHQPVLRIGDGDTVITTIVDAFGKGANDTLVTPRGNPQTGPFYIEGIEPGETLAVYLDPDPAKPGDWLHWRVRWIRRCSTPRPRCCAG
jgi:amidase